MALNKKVYCLDYLSYKNLFYTASKKNYLTNIWEVDSSETKYSTTKEALQYFNELKTNHNFKCFFPVNLLQVSLEKKS